LIRALSVLEKPAVTREVNRQAVVSGRRIKINPNICRGADLPAAAAAAAAAVAAL